jgi:hypothetical protein
LFLLAPDAVVVLVAAELERRQVMTKVAAAINAGNLRVESEDGPF